MSNETTCLIINSFTESAVLYKKTKKFRWKEYKYNVFKLGLLWKKIGDFVIKICIPNNTYSVHSFGWATCAATHM